MSQNNEVMVIKNTSNLPQAASFERRLEIYESK